MKRLLLTLIAAIAATVATWADTYVVAVGISDYQYINDLRLPENDAKTIARIFKTHTPNVITITGQYATRQTILQSLRDQFGRAKEADQVIFYFSGHGYENGFCPYDQEPNGRNAISYSDVASIMRSSKAKSKVILADACHSGGMRLNAKRNAKPKPGANVMLFLSCRDKEKSIETPNMQNGFFTTYLERGLRGGADTNYDRNITALELFTYVSQGVRDISNDRQHPVMWGKFKDSMSIIRW